MICLFLPVLAAVLFIPYNCVMFIFACFGC